MPLFRYHITHGSETKTVELRKSNPQGWLLDAVRATFPEVATRWAEMLFASGSKPLTELSSLGGPDSTTNLVTS